MEFRAIKTTQSKSNWVELPVAEWDSEIIPVTNDTEHVAIASWRWDVGSASENSPNLVKVVQRAAELKYDYVLADIISLDQSSQHIMDLVATFSEFYYHLPSVTSYGNDLQDNSRGRTWIANELIRMVTSRTQVAEIVPDLFETDSELSRTDAYAIVRALLSKVAPDGSKRSDPASDGEFAILISDYMPRPVVEKLGELMQLRFCDLFPSRARSVLFGIMATPFSNISVTNQRFTSDILVVFALWANLPKELVGRLQSLRSGNKFVRMVIILVLATKFQYFDGGLFGGFDVKPSDWLPFARIMFGTPNEPFQSDQGCRPIDECTVWEMPADDKGKSDIGMDEPGQVYTITNMETGASHTNKQKFAEHNRQLLEEYGLLNQAGCKIECSKFATDQELAVELSTSEMMARSRKADKNFTTKRDPKVTCKYAIFGNEDGDMFACSVVRQGRCEVVVKQYCVGLLEKLVQVWPKVADDEWDPTVSELLSGDGGNKPGIVTAMFRKSKQLVRSLTPTKSGRVQPEEGNVKFIPWTE